MLWPSWQRRGRHACSQPRAAAGCPCALCPVDCNGSSSSTTGAGARAVARLGSCCPAQRFEVCPGGFAHPCDAGAGAGVLRRQLRTPEVRLLWVHACALLSSTTSGSPQMPLLCRCCGERVICSTADDNACSVYHAQLGHSGSVSVPVAERWCVLRGWCRSARTPHRSLTHRSLTGLALLFKLNSCAVFFCAGSLFILCWERLCEAAGSGVLLGASLRGCRRSVELLQAPIGGGSHGHSSGT